ncbi:MULTISPECIES: YusW family protein [Alteribacter]|uniref:YusW-like protein n=1 Tax=Alteribacter keqinensis TaxID=2483800 RepID=A0A3M7TLC1_9BACI|nr:MULTISPECIES: YusW family protein [Alteribacter]MBM7096711.1 YusW family protein [Alteribacter salitolerans]RNA66261.1 hypothetical protein EBO34_19260 [Alteribacter keqinensis]
MKKFGLSIGTLALTFSLAACGDAEEQQDDTATDDNGEVEQHEEDESDDELGLEDDEEADDGELADEASDAWYEDLNFIDFQLDAQYEEGDYSVEYNYNEGTPEATIEDARTEEELTLEGDEALNELEQILPELDLTVDMSEEEIREATAEAFELDETYEELQVDVQFKDEVPGEEDDEGMDLGDDDDEVEVEDENEEEDEQ